MTRTADLLDIMNAAVRAAAPGQHVERAIATAPELQGDAHVHLLAVGKAAGTMAQAALGALRHPPVSALVIVPDGAPACSGVTVMRARHPLPDERSHDAGRAIEDMLARAATGDTVLVLISGGASALAVLPIPPLTVTEYAARVHTMMLAGADIFAVNALRRGIDRLKGGGMARMARHTRVLGLVLSDVVGDPLNVIASGPLCDPAGTGVRLEIVAGNRTAVDAAAAHARTLAYDVTVLPDPVTGEARSAGSRLARTAALLPPGSCLVAGGETTVTVRGNGRGGRNLEIVLAACIATEGRRMTFGSCATDGVDGSTDAAGAWTDETTLDRARALALQPERALEANDSYSFFAGVDGLIRTGPTGTNVMDVHVALIPHD